MVMGLQITKGVNRKMDGDRMTNISIGALWQLKNERNITGNDIR